VAQFNVISGFVWRTEENHDKLQPENPNVGSWFRKYIAKLLISWPRIWLHFNTFPPKLFNLQSGHISRQKFYTHLSFLPLVPHAPLQSFSLVLITLAISHYDYTLRGIALQNIAIPCVFLPSLVQIFSTQCSQTYLNVRQAYKHLHNRNRISRCLGHMSGITMAK